MIPSHPHLPRGNSKVDQNNKKYVKQWLKRLGVPTVIYSKMLIGPMNEVYNDTSDMKINKLLQSIPPKDIAATLERVQKDMEAEELKKSGNLPEKRKREKKSEPTTKPELKESAGEDPFEMPFRLPKLLKRGGRQETPSSNGKLLLPRLDYGKCYRCDRDFGSLLEQMRHEYGMHKFIDAGLIRRADGAALTCFPCVFCGVESGVVFATMGDYCQHIRGHLDSDEMDVDGNRDAPAHGGADNQAVVVAPLPLAPDIVPLPRPLSSSTDEENIPEEQRDSRGRSPAEHLAGHAADTDTDTIATTDPPLPELPSKPAANFGTASSRLSPVHGPRSDLMPMHARPAAAPRFPFASGGHPVPRQEWQPWQGSIGVAEMRFRRHGVDDGGPQSGVREQPRLTIHPPPQLNDHSSQPMVMNPSEVLSPNLATHRDTDAMIPTPTPMPISAGTQRDSTGLHATTGKFPVTMEPTGPPRRKVTVALPPRQVPVQAFTSQQPSGVPVYQPTPVAGPALSGKPVYHPHPKPGMNSFRPHDQQVADQRVQGRAVFTGHPIAQPLGPSEGGRLIGGGPTPMPVTPNEQRRTTPPAVRPHSFVASIHPSQSHLGLNSSKSTD
eukprot:m.155082 g.155082  ORF g.155082 m.155082 type:complete len:609 (+) comp14394_c0_seq1:213-2039(+)